MKITRRQLRRMILEEVNNVSEAADATSAKGAHHLKDMFDYMLQAGMKYSPMVIAYVMMNYADEINMKLQKEGPKAAAKKFISIAKNI